MQVMPTPSSPIGKTMSQIPFRQGNAHKSFIVNETSVGSRKQNGDRAGTDRKRKRTHDP
jgi:hypothetical protein